MFTKLKQKIAEEDHSDLGSSLPSSPSSSRKFRPVSKENKWHRRRMNSVSSYYGSRESLFTEPGFISRDPSFTNGLANTLDNSYGVSNHSKPRKDLVSILQEKTQEINKLKNKLSDCEEEIERWKGLYEEQSAREQELTKNVENKFQMSHTQIDARQKALDILEKGSQLEELDQAYKDQKTQLSSMMEKLDELTKQRCRFEEEEQTLKQQTSKLETENKTLKGQLNDIITEVTQKSVELSKVQKCLELREKELNELQELYNSLKTQTSADILEKDNKIKSLENRLTKGESSHSDLANSEDDWMNDFLKEGRDKSSEVNALATLVGSLNEKLERKDKELTSCKRVAEETIDDLKEKIKTLENDTEKSQNKQRSNDQLDALKQRNSYLEKELENVRGQLTSAKRSKENRPTWRRSSDAKLEERSRCADKEFRQKEARYESQLADLQEERDQLQSELLIKDEECAQISLCLDEALKNTSDLKQQIKSLEEALEEKTSVSGMRTKSAAEGPPKTVNVEIMEALRQELEESREHNKLMDDEVHERDASINSLRNEVRLKDDELRRCKTKLAQFEENNKLADRKRIIEITSSRDDYRTKDSYRQSFSHKTRLKELEDQVKLREDLDKISLDENENLRRQINEKDMKIKTLQQKLVDLKKAFQRELKSSVECLEVNGTTDHFRNNIQAGLLVSCATQTDNEDLEYLNMNFKYLKHVIIKYMCSTNEKSRQMLPIVGHLLRLTPKELDLIKDTFEWKLPLD